MMDDATVDAVARMLADKCRAAANDPLGSSAFGATTSGRGAQPGKRRPDNEQEEHEQLLLREVAASQAEASAEAHIEAEAMWHMAREYEREATRLSELLERAGIPPRLLTPRARLLSALAARVADALGAARATPDHALACWADLAVRESRAVALKAAADARAADMRAEAAAVEARAAALAEAHASTRNAQQGGAAWRAKLEARSVQEMEAKRAEYERVVSRCERKVAAAGAADRGLRHAELARRAARLADKREQLKALERRAAEFADLPASVAGARAAVEQARERLAHSQEQLELGLAQL